MYHLGQQRQHLRDLGVADLVALSPEQLLNHSEAQRLQTYVEAWAGLEQRCQWEDLVCHLGDNPAANWKTWSAVNGACPTLRRSGGLMAVTSC